MALKPCRECKKKVSTEAAACPSCGVPNPTNNNVPKKKSENVYEKIWSDVEDAYNMCEATYDYVSSKLDRDSQYRIHNIALYFYRGMYEASCEINNINKEDFKKAVMYCTRREWDKDKFRKISDEEKDKHAKENYDATEVGLTGGGKTGIMCQRICETGNKSFKSQGVGNFAALSKLWKDQNIAFTETVIGRSIKNFFGL